MLAWVSFLNCTSQTSNSSATQSKPGLETKSNLPTDCTLLCLRSPFKTSWAQELESELSHAVVGFADLFFDGEPSPVWQHIGDVLPVGLDEIRHELACTAEEITPGKLARGVSGIVKDAFEGFRREWEETGGQW